jgi:predicted nucleic acid-binding protein
MIVYYLDASAWVKRYYAESGSDRVRELLARGAIMASASLGVLEVAAALARKGKAGEIPPASLEQALTTLRHDWERFAQIHLTDDVLADALGVARTRALRAADAVHLASALVVAAELSPQEDTMTFVVSDRELRQAAVAAGLRVLDPTQP